MSQPYLCPVCSGSGIVPNGFYNRTTTEWTTSSNCPEKCRACNGAGIVWSPRELKGDRDE